MTLTFALPFVLWLLAVPVLVLAWDLVQGRRAAAATFPKILRAEAGTRQLDFAARRPASFGRLRPRLWLAVGLSLGVGALARPQWGQVEEQVFDRSREILIAVDLSRSMLVGDVKPSRLERAKLLIQALLERLEGERVGLMLFAGTAFVQSPLSSDYEILLEFLPELGPRYLPAGGSDYGRMLDAAVGAFTSEVAADRFLVVLSDGEATDEEWRTRLEGARARGIRAIGLGIGTSEGGLIPDGSGGFVKDERGAVVLSKLEPLTLQELAKETNGAYRDASGWVDLPLLIQETIATGQRGEFIEERQVRRIERYQWFLAPALFFLLLSYWREFPVRPRPRDLRLAGDPAATRAAAALAVSALGLLGGPAEARAAEPPDPAQAVAVAAVPVSKVVGRLSGQDRPAAGDWGELARTTVTYGQQLRDMTQPVPEGPIQDALAAVAAGRAMDARAADWERLKRELEELLKKPDEPPPPEEEPPPPAPENQEQQNSPENKQGDQGKEGEKSDEPSQSKEGDPQSQKQDSKEGEKSPEEKKQDGEQPPEEEAFGDMDQPMEEPTDEPPPEESQKVGGATQGRPDNTPVDPSLAMPMQRLDALRDQDSPAELFQRMDRAENPTQKRSEKDW